MKDKYHPDYLHENTGTETMLRNVKPGQSFRYPNDKKINRVLDWVGDEMKVERYDGWKVRRLCQWLDLKVYVI